MYLTRMKLNVSKRDTMKALSCLNLFHGAVEDSLKRDGKRKLWRIDYLNGEYYLMIVSYDQPELSTAVRQFGFPDSQLPWECLEYDKLLQKLNKGGRWHFRLTANPTRSVLNSKETLTRGTVHAHVGVKHQTEWLIKHAEQNGFRVNEEDVAVVNSRWYSFRKKSSTNHKVTLLSVTFEGVLEIEDSVLFAKTLTSGIGRGKAYGQGMLTIARR